MLLLQTDRLSLRLSDYFRAEHYDIRLRPDHQYVIGQVQLRFERGSTEAALGYYVHELYRRKGYATEGARTLIEHGFRDLGFRRIFATVECSNGASIRVAEKCGLRISVRGDAWLAYGIESIDWWIQQGGRHATHS